MKRPCLDCGKAIAGGSRCARCQRVYIRDVRGTPAQRGYDPAWRALSAQVLREWRARHGSWCPGWQCPPHQSDDLTCDHIVPLDAGGTNTRDNVSVLCRVCQGRKGNRQYPNPPPQTQRRPTTQDAAARRRRRGQPPPQQQVWIA